jgi:hypothetical protein
MEHPPGFTLIGAASRRGGRLELLSRADPPALLVRAYGYVGPSLLREDLSFAARFGAERPQGWDYIVDTTYVRVANPLNPLWLRKIRGLPNLRRYLVVAPNPAVRAMIRAMGWLVRPDQILERLDA